MASWLISAALFAEVSLSCQQAAFPFLCKEKESCSSSPFLSSLFRTGSLLIQWPPPLSLLLFLLVSLSICTLLHFLTLTDTVHLSLLSLLSSLSWLTSLGVRQGVSAARLCHLPTSDSVDSSLMVHNPFRLRLKTANSAPTHPLKSSQSMCKNTRINSHTNTPQSILVFKSTVSSF